MGNLVQKSKETNMKKRLIIFLCVVVALLGINQIAYLAKVQFTCTEKINRGEDLNAYETFSALQTHTAFWMFGWVVSPNTAQLCFDKQFKVLSPYYFMPIPMDDTVEKALRKLDRKEAKEVRLTWKSYSTSASIYLNGSTVSKAYCDDIYGGDYYLFKIPSDYKPGIIKIWGVTLSETVFDYLENKGYLSSYTYHRLL